LISAALHLGDFDLGQPKRGGVGRKCRWREEKIHRRKGKKCGKSLRDMK